MSLQQLKVTRFRNLSSVDISPSSSLNFLYGVNGSGKTSLLEAISVLAHGRSFRTRKFRRLIQQELSEFTVFGRVDTTGKAGVAMGVTRGRSGDSQFRIDGAGINSSAELAVHLPLLILNAESFGLLAGSPKQRRQFFDWLVFHVKPEFRETWRNYSRCVKQRNSLLRRDKIAYSDLYPWDIEIARLSLSIERNRVACVEPFLDEFRLLAADLDSGFGEIGIEYLSGWKTNEDYQTQLRETFSRDRKLGYTSLGPHKSDLKITIGGGFPAGEILSRGQQKSMIAALHVAEARVFTTENGQGCVFLIDDMPAELDAANIDRVGRWINNTAAQVFVTGVEFKPMRDIWPELDQKAPKVFHVKQGDISEIPWEEAG
jgi:DNA replication and repair protein RecF